MPNGQPGAPELKAIDPKEELKKARLNHKNLLFQVSMSEALIKKLEELSR